MEKISNIVRGSSRVASTDIKASPAVRPGSPSYGRPIGESPLPSEKSESTAARATAIQNELNENKRQLGQDRVVAQMADNFFNTRIRGTEPGVLPKGKAKMAEEEGKLDLGITNSEATKALAKSSDDLILEDTRNVESEPVGYKPRGSYVDVHA